MAIEGIIGKKVGMTQVFAEDGALVPVTVIQAGPCLVVQKKTAEVDGYNAVQVGLVEKVSNRRVTGAQRGHFEKAGIPPVRTLVELPYNGEANVGDKIQVDIFKAGDSIDVIGQSKGKGFQGVVKRHHFKGGRATHGSMFHRAPGSIGASAFPSRSVDETTGQVAVRVDAAVAEKRPVRARRLDGREVARDHQHLLAVRARARNDTSRRVGDEALPPELDARAADRTLTELAIAFSNDHVTLQGNCDERGSRGYNLALGQRRADAVKQSMVLLGVPQERIETISFGKEKPRALCHEQTCWAENRRADFGL